MSKPDASTWTDAEWSVLAISRLAVSCSAIGNRLRREGATEPDECGRTISEQARHLADMAYLDRVLGNREPVSPTMMALYERAAAAQADYAAARALMTPEELAADDERRIEAGMAFIMDTSFGGE